MGSENSVEIVKRKASVAISRAGHAVRWNDDFEAANVRVVRGEQNTLVTGDARQDETACTEMRE